MFLSNDVDYTLIGKKPTRFSKIIQQRVGLRVSAEASEAKPDHLSL